jgi:hypothetical protein
MNSTEVVHVATVNYTVFVNYDYGSARGIDITLEKRNGILNGNIQYTYSVAKANRADPWEGYRNTDNPLTMPKKEIVMSFDRTHNLTSTISINLPEKRGPFILGFYPLQDSRLSLTNVTMSGAPYTPVLPNNREGPMNSERMPWYITTNMAFRKYFDVMSTRYSIGVLVQNLFNRRNPIDIYPRTGSADDPGRQAHEFIKDGLLSKTYYDRPWYYDDMRQIDFFVEVHF